MDEVAIRVVSGIIGAILTWGTLRYWPAMINFATKETRLRGDWKWFDSTSDNQIGVVVLNQIGGHVHGEFKRTTSTNGHSTSRVFKFTGSIYGHTLSLSYWEPEDPNNVKGSVIFRVVSGRAVMYGKSVYFDGYAGVIRVTTFLLSRNDSLSEAERAYLANDGVLPHLPGSVTVPIQAKLNCDVPTADATPPKQAAGT
jgi:hypothetical protein